MRYIYCALHGGFNDMLCQMLATWDYARSSGRTLVFDARHGSFQDSLANYFVSLEKDTLLHPTKNLLRHLNSLSAFPPSRQGCVDSDKAVYTDPCTFVDPETRVELSFDFKRQYSEEVLVRHCCGGCACGALYLEKLRLLPEVAEPILRALEKLDHNYVAIHVRNTDYQTEYLPFFKSIFPQMAGKSLLICSDDWACRESAKKFFVESRVMTVTDIPDTGGAPLHMSKGNAREKNLAMLTDLFALAGADDLHFSPVKAGGILSGMSGFSLLALQLQLRPDIRNTVLGLSPG